VPHGGAGGSCSGPLQAHLAVWARGGTAAAASVTHVVRRGQNCQCLGWRAAPRARLVQTVDATKQWLGVRRRGWGYYSQAPGLLMTPPKRPRLLAHGRRFRSAVEPRTWTSCNQGPSTVQAWPTLSARRSLVRACLPEATRAPPRPPKWRGNPNRQTDRSSAARACIGWRDR